MKKIKLFGGKCVTGVQSQLDTFLENSVIKDIIDIKIESTDSRYDSIILVLTYEGVK